MLRRTKNVLAVGAAAALFVLGPATAYAAEPADEPDSAMQLAAEEGITDPVLLVFVAEVSEGVETISVNAWELTPEAGTGAGMAPAAFPSGCGAVTIVTQTKPGSGGRSTINGDTVVSCPVSFTSGSISNTMSHFNPDWGIWTTGIDYNVKTGQSGRSMTNETSYTCANTNRSNYRVASSGSIRIGGVSYTGSGYDVFDSNVNCGR